MSDNAHSFTIAIASDHGGYELKQQLILFLNTLGHRVEDLGTTGKDSVDCAVFARAVAERVAARAAEFGIVIDGEGIGSAMAANKVPGVLAAACYNEQLARNAREHNGANVLAIGARMMDLATAKQIVNIFLTTEGSGDLHRERVQLFRDIERAYMKPSGGAMLSGDNIQRIANQDKPHVNSASRPPEISHPLPPEKIAKLIDHTLLRPEATPADIERLCDEARKYGFHSVCVNSAYVKHASALLRNSGVKICSVVGFPLGATEPQIKALEAQKAIEDGASEIDMVINIGALKARDDEFVVRDIRGVVESCRNARALCKVILETALLTDEEKERACRLSMKAGADFVKTSTGFSSGGATPEDVALLARLVAPWRMGVKASGGIRTYADVVKMVNAGATRIGCSNSVKIMEEARTGISQTHGGEGY